VRRPLTAFARRFLDSFLAAVYLVGPFTIVDARLYTFSNINIYNTVATYLILYILSISGNKCRVYLPDNS